MSSKNINFIKMRHRIISKIINRKISMLDAKVASLPFHNLFDSLFKILWKLNNITFPLQDNSYANRIHH